MPSTSRAHIELIFTKPARVDAAIEAAAGEMWATLTPKCSVNKTPSSPPRYSTRTIVVNLEDTTWKRYEMRCQHIDGAAATHSVLS